MCSASARGSGKRKKNEQTGKQKLEIRKWKREESALGKEKEKNTGG
jgi:hypothetical protein